MQVENREVLGYQEWPSGTEETATEQSDASAEAEPPEPEVVDRRGFFRRVGGAAQQSATK